MLTVVTDDFRMDAPGGGNIRVRAGRNAPLTLVFSDAATAREALRTARRLAPGSLSVLRLLRRRNPLAQDVEISIGERTTVRWPRGRKMKLTSLRGLLALL